MYILTLRTDKPEAEVGLFLDRQQLAYETWQAHRQLAETIHNTITEVLISQKISWPEVQGLVVFQGPGSFTGLRIGVTVANALAASLEAPIVGSMGENWVHTGIERLLDDQSDTIVLPEYGALPNITVPRK